MAGFYHNLNKERSYHQGFFLATSLIVAGLCSVFPMMCFKNYSGKERARKKAVAETHNVKQKLRQAEAELDEVLHLPPRVKRHHSNSPRRVAHTPQSHARRHSSATHHSDRPSRHHSRQHPESRHAYDRQLDRERDERHHGHPPARRYHHSSWEGVLGPMPTF